MAEPRYYDIRRSSGVAGSIDIDNSTVESAGNTFFDVAVIRALGPKGWGIVTVDNFGALSKPDVKGLITEASNLALVTEEAVVLADAPSGLLPTPSFAEDPRDVSMEEKCSLLAEIESAAKVPGVTNTRARYSETATTVTFTDSSDQSFTYEMVRSGYSVLAVAAKNGMMQMGRESNHTVTGLNLRSQQEKGRAAGERAVSLLDAKAAKGGRMSAVLDQELGGVFAHEAVGHASEGDLVKEGASVLAGKTGELIGRPCVSVTDDPTLPMFGFMPVDDEGVRVQRTPIIKNGVLTNFLHSRQTLAAVGDGIAGHARAQTGAVPVVRMSNTFIENGDSSYGEIVEECRNGILLKGSRGGQVDPGRGAFQFNAEYGYLIENGELGEMVRDVSLSGDILSTLHNISLCGSDLKLSPGFCGKAGQSVPVTDGAPHLLLLDAVVGGQGV